MNVEKNADYLYNILASFNLLNVTYDTLCNLKLGDFAFIKDDLPEPPLFDNDNVSILKKLIKTLIEISQSKNQTEIWDSFRLKEVSPSLFEALCFLLLSKDNGLFQYGAKIYTILLGLEIRSTIWNPNLFNSVLSLLISAQQILENGSNLSDETKSQLENGFEILNILNKSISDSLINLLGPEVLIALMEITVKLCTGIRPELEKYNQDFLKCSLDLLKKIPNDNLDYLLPFLVEPLLLKFAINSNTLTLRIEKIRDKILEFVLTIFKSDDPRLELLCKHLILRSPEKAHLKRSASYVVFKISLYYDNTKDIINFVMKLSKSSKIGNRSIASYLLQLYIVNIEELEKKIGDESSELIMQMVGCIKSELTDISSTVRSNGLDAVSNIISNLNTNSFGTVIKHIIDTNGYLFNILKRRSIDEKHVVRKAAIICIYEIIKTMKNSLLLPMIDLLTDRIRDKAVSIRQTVIRYLSSCLDIFPDNKELIEIWLDNVLPSALDTEKTVQTEAFQSIEKYLFSQLTEGRGKNMTSMMKDNHFEVLKSVFLAFKQRGVSLSKISNELTKMINNENDFQIWMIIDILTNVVPNYFKVNTFGKLWEQRDTFPPEYYSILGNLKYKDEKVKEDCLTKLNELIQLNDSEYKLINNIIQLLYVQIDKSSYIWSELISKCCDLINSISQTESVESRHLSSLLSAIYALGVIISKSDKSIVHDFDFTGIELLISSKLPNGTNVPLNIQAISTLTLGKLCIIRKDISTSFVSAFIHQLTSNNDCIIKCNCLIVLCDLCICYSSLVDPHIQLMTNSFVDSSQVVQFQTLHIVTKLIVEDFLKLKPLLFFKYVYMMTDNDKSVAVFAQSCLLNVIMNKFPNIITSNIIDTIYYFSGQIEMPLLGETEQEKKIFRNISSERRKRSLSILISNLNEVSTFTLIQTLFTQVLSRFINEELDIFKHSIVLEDVIYCLNDLEDKMKQSIEVDSLSEDPTSNILFEAGKKMMEDIHKKIITEIFPSLNKLHRMLRNHHSPCQNQLKLFYQKICNKHSNLLEQLQNTEPILATELKHEMEMKEELEVHTPPCTPKKTSIYESPLLSKIASTPRSSLCTPNSSFKNSLISTPPRSSNMQLLFSTPKHDGNLD